MKGNATIYRGTRKLKDLQTGEIMEVDFTERNVIKYGRSGFEIIYLAFLSGVFDKLGGKKYAVLKYLLENRDTYNQLCITDKELIKKTGVSAYTVTSTINLLKQSGVIKRKTNHIMIAPKLIHRGSENKEIFLLQKFKYF